MNFGSPTNRFTTSLLLLFSFLAPLTAQDDGIKYLEVKVLNPDGKPMPDATVEISVDGMAFPMMTDREGIVPINYPSEGANLQLTVIEEGYAALGISWRNTDKIPAEFTIPMQKGIPIGGIVHDPDGNPIEGVLVSGYDSINDSQPGKAKLQPRLRGELVTTNAEGRWQIDAAPEKPMRLQLKFSHPDYVSDPGYSFRGGTWAQLLTLKHIVVLNKGIELRGKVTDPDGKPIAGAVVGTGSDRFNSGNLTVETDANGEYVLKKVQAGSTVLTVFAEHWAPDLRTVVAKYEMPSVDFSLTPGHTIQVRVTDHQGEPLAGVWLAPDTWRGHRSLQGLAGRYETNAEGVWQSDSAPHDAVQYGIIKQGYMSLRRQILTAQDDEHVIVLSDPLVVQGNVADAETGKPINEFVVVQGIRWDQSRQNTYWERHNVQKTQSDGAFQTQFTEPRFGHLIKIEADGYRPGISRVIKSDEGTITIDFKLEPGIGPSGVVKTPDGKPAGGAKVVIAVAGQYTQIYNGQPQQHQNTPIVEADADGRFTLPFPEGDYLVAILHDKGWQQLDGQQLEDTPEITLQPWAEVQGKLIQGNEPMIGENIQSYFQQVHRQNQPNLHWSNTASTDGEGAFHFKRVRAGTTTIGRQIRFADRGNGGSMSATTHSEQVEVKAGETAEIQIGGKGRIVQGQCIVPDDYEGEIPWNMGTVALYEVEPNNYLQALGRAFSQLIQQTAKSRQPAKQVHRKNYTATFDDQGAFVIHDIQPATYQMRVTIYQQPVGRNYNWQPLATFNQIITIPQGTTPHNTGKHTLTIENPQPTP